MLRLLGFFLWLGPRVVYLMRHPSVPFGLKLLPVVAIAYVLLPVDFLRDFIPVLGWLDDAWVVILLMTIFMAVGNRYASRPRRDGGKTITTSYEVLDPKRDDDSNPKQGTA